MPTSVGDSAATPGYAVMNGGWKNAKAPEPSNVYPRKNVDEGQKPFVTVDPNAAWGRKLKGLPGGASSSPSVLDTMPDLVASIDEASGFVRYSRPAPSSLRPEDTDSIITDVDSASIAPSEVTLVNAPSDLPSGRAAVRDSPEQSDEYFVHVGRAPHVADEVTIYRDAASAEAGGVEVGKIQHVKPTLVEMTFTRRSAGSGVAFYQNLTRTGTFVKTWPCKLPAVSGGSTEPSFKWKKAKDVPGGWMLSDSAGQDVALGISQVSEDTHSVLPTSLKFLREGLDRTAIEQILVTWVALKGDTLK